MEYIKTLQQPVLETDSSGFGTLISIKSTAQERDEEHFKVFDISRNLQVDDGNHYVPHLANDPQLIAKRRLAKPGERMQRQQRAGLLLGVRMLMGSVEPESTNYLANVLSSAMLNSAWYERFGSGRGARTDKTVMRSPVEMPRQFIDPEENLQEYQLKEIIARQMVDLSNVAETQAGVINNIRVRSDNLAAHLHKGMGYVSGCLSALRDYEEIALLTNKVARAERIREAIMQTDRNARVLYATTGQHPSIAALAEPLSNTTVHLRKTAPTKTTEAAIEFAYARPMT